MGGDSYGCLDGFPNSISRYSFYFLCFFGFLVLCWSFLIQVSETGFWNNL